MKVDIESIGSFQRKLAITVPANKVSTELDRAFKQLSQRVRLRGFRPGKAPRRVLEARFGGEIRSDVANTLIQDGYREAIESQSLEPVGQPALDDAGEIKGGNDFAFTVLVDVKPSVELEALTGVEVVFPKAEVAEEELSAALKARLEGQARLVEVSDRGVELGDMVLVELEIKDGDEVVASEPGTMIRTEADPYYPGVEALLVGKKSGEEAAGEVSFGDDARTETVAGRTLNVSAKVLSIQANEVPDLTDELAEELGYEGGSTGMTEAIRAELMSGREEMARNQARANLLEELIRLNPFDVPGGMVDSSLNMLMEELRLQQAYRGVDPRHVHFSDEQIADLRVRAEFAAKAGLILEHVADSQEIAVTDADLELKYQEMADSRGQTLEAVKSYFIQPDAVEELRNRLLEEKTLDWLLEKAKLVDAKPETPVEAAAEKPKKKAKKTKKAAPKAEAAAPAAGEADLSVLKGAVGKVKEAVAAIDDAASLQALLDAEQAGKARKGAIAAIEKRLAEVG